MPPMRSWRGSRTRRPSRRRPPWSRQPKLWWPPRPRRPPAWPSPQPPLACLLPCGESPPSKRPRPKLRRGATRGAHAPASRRTTRGRCLASAAAAAAIDRAMGRAGSSVLRRAAEARRSDRRDDRVDLCRGALVAPAPSSQWPGANFVAPDGGPALSSRPGDREPLPESPPELEYEAERDTVPSPVQSEDWSVSPVRSAKPAFAWRPSRMSTGAMAAAVCRAGERDGGARTVCTRVRAGARDDVCGFFRASVAAFGGRQRQH